MVLAQLFVPLLLAVALAGARAEPLADDHTHNCYTRGAPHTTTPLHASAPACRSTPVWSGEGPAQSLRTLDPAPARPSADLWSDAKKEWCCQERGIGCAAEREVTPSPTPRLHSRRLSASPAPRSTEGDASSIDEVQAAMLS